MHFLNEHPLASVARMERSVIREIGAAIPRIPFRFIRATSF